MQIDDKIWLGKTGITISPLGIGTWQWGDRFTWDYGRGGFSDADLQASYQACVTQGINFFDTAEVYGRGQSERLLGKFSRADGREVVIATKFMPFPWRVSRSELLKALKGSLARLGLPRVDLYQIHWPMPPHSTRFWVEALGDAMQSGLARAVGVSNYSREQTLRAHDLLTRQGIPLASNQVRFSLLDRKAERNGLLQACRERGITLIAYSPLAQGLLTGKYTLQQPLTGDRRRRLGRYLAPVQPLITLLRSMGEARDGKTPAQVALNWVVAKGAVPIPGAKNARQAQENLGALGWQLTQDEIAILDQASADIS